MLLVNGRLFGPLELDGQSFTAGIVAHAEELELDFGPMQFQELKRALAPWLCQMSVLAVRARSVVESFAARSGETTEEKSEDGEQLQDFMLLSVQLVAPDDWLCSPVDSAADLDSIPAHAPRGSPGAKVHVRYEVEALFLEGVAEACGCISNSRAVQQVVKSGYFQLRQKPGVQLGQVLGCWVAAGSSNALNSRYQLSLHSNEERLLRPKGLVQLADIRTGQDTRTLNSQSCSFKDLAGRGSLLEARVGKIGLGEAGEDSTKSLPAPMPVAGCTSELLQSKRLRDRLNCRSSQAVFLFDFSLILRDEESTQNFEGAGGDPAECSETIHIFSVASGLRYERLLRIMMLSVRKHTKCKLRFWLVENFLSPRFRRILPGLAEQVGFAVSRVTYKWPTWLREQTQKQRVIWAYKILFLDVFFPAEVKRILFIDADQIVRANAELSEKQSMLPKVEELWRMDIKGPGPSLEWQECFAYIKGHVYGFVPFCGSGPPESLTSHIWGSLTGKAAKQEDLKNPDTVGFRFWEQGFWKNHLAGRHYYHISALFVVDLEVFRQTGAGDTLRDVYQSLTADPHSLANLDQDLPNYIQANLPIYSLPQEWLWCESWSASFEESNLAKLVANLLAPSRKGARPGRESQQNREREGPDGTKIGWAGGETVEKVKSLPAKMHENQFGLYHAVKSCKGSPPRHLLNAEGDPEGASAA
eukprot:s1993_g13.t1